VRVIIEYILYITRGRTGRTLLLKSHISFVITIIERIGSYFDTSRKDV
jgi:hypothetical protein